MLFNSYRNNNNNNSSRGSNILTVVLIILIIVIILACLCAYVSMIILYVFLCIGLAIGFIYALYMYIKAFIASVPVMKAKHVTSGTISNFFYKSFILLKETSVLACKNNVNAAKSAVIRANAYRVLSFKKWMWLMSAVSMIVLGTALIIVLGFAQVLVLLAFCFAVIQLLVLLILCCCLINSFSSVKDNIIIAHGTCRVNSLPCFEFTKKSNFKGLGQACGKYYVYMFNIMKDLYTENLSLMSKQLTSAMSFSLFNIKRYFFISKILITLFVGVMFILLISIWRFIAFFPLIIANFAWTSIIEIINH